MIIERLKTTGIITYDPYRGGMKRRTAWWCVANIDREITRYYRWLIMREYWAHTAINPDWLKGPAWDAHVSVVRGEEPRGEDLKELWKKYDGERVTIEYDSYPQFNKVTTGFGGKPGTFWFINAYCPEITYIRNELGLKTFHNSHLTIGKVYA